MAKRLATPALVVAWLLVLAIGSARAESALETLVNQGLGVTDSVIQPLSFSIDVDTGLLYTTVTPGAGTFWTLELGKHSLRADDFQLLVDDGTGLVPTPAPPIATYRGTVVETGAHVRASFVGGQLSAIIFDTAGTWSVQPIADAGVSGFPADLHAVFSALADIPTGHVCGTHEPNGFDGAEGVGPGAIPFGSGRFICDLGLDADFEFYSLDNGSSVTQTVNSMENLVNNVENIYDSQAQIIYEITTIIVRTVSGSPYTSTVSDTLLGQFENTWGSAPENAIRHDLAHLFTGKELNGSVIGQASGIGTVCNSGSRYAISQAFFNGSGTQRTALVAHEMGHDWDASHCDGSTCRIMCSVINQCSGLNPLSFAPNPLAQIIAHRDTRTCLTIEPSPISLPFFEGVTSTSLMSGVWVFNQGAVVSTAAVGEPSGTQSLNLDSPGSGLYEDNELRSTEILLAGTTNPILSYFTQHRGVEAGEELIIEYLNVQFDWIEINRVTSNGVDQNVFTSHTHNLPVGARHNGFRLRFRVAGNDTGDDWYLDDIAISNGIVPPQLASVSPNSGPTTGGTLVSINGSNFTADAVVFFGIQPLNSQQYVNTALITGIAPPGASGAVDVIVSQTSGSSTLPSGFSYTNNVLHIENGVGTPGGLATLRVLADHDQDLSGFSFGVDFDSAFLTPVAATLTGTSAEGAAFFQSELDGNPEPGGFVTVGVVFDLMLASVIPAANDDPLVNLELAIDAATPLGFPLVLDFSGALGQVPVELCLVPLSGQCFVPGTVPGILQLVAGSLFVRGDSNGDSTVNVADAVFILTHLFSMGPAECLDAVDVNDDGQANIADAVALLNHLFSMGANPPAPFPNPGTDPTADGLDCNF
ncbi:MAG: M12 family metallo-peptidase [Planctomycetota bacterium]